MTERELAGLLFDMGLKSGLELEQAADEIASMSLPSFVHAQAFRSAVMQTVEAHMRSQMEQRLLAMRQKFDATGQASAAVAEQTEPRDLSHRHFDQKVAGTRTEAIADAGTLDTIIADMTIHDEGSPDATIVWSPRRD